MSYFQPRPLLDGPTPSLGPGVSRPKPNERTRMYRVLVAWPDRRKMVVTIPAPSKAKASSYCRNRWPDCTAEVQP